jgi:uncharacterized protein YjbI with pentapeptide repeats
LFPQADLSGADLQGGRFDGAIWAETTLDGASLRGASLSLCIFQRARCADTDFRGANLADADFSLADLGGADLRDATFLRTRMHRALTQGTRWTQRRGIIENDAPLLEAELWSAGRASL